jgi:phosphatidylglycerophosphate synthase
MKTIKMADLVIQSLLFICTVSFAVITKGDNESFFYPYFAVGGWQLLSLIANLLISSGSLKHYERINYGKVILLLLLIGIAFLLLALLKSPYILYYLVGLLIVSPFLALWYFSIGYRELKLIYKKEFIHLK